ncbi:hypothetical protein BDR26DRAFT_865506 [Obelidium mucronatum]|nr:hypothetical protein BDR26DRAFT_865506 [Obelidium mucronatum]
MQLASTSHQTSAISNNNRTGSITRASMSAANDQYLYEQTVRKLFHQLTAGCGTPLCTFRLCASNSQVPRLATQAAAIMAVQLSSKTPIPFCPRLSNSATLSQKTNDAFLESLLAAKNASTKTRSNSALSSQKQQFVPTKSPLETVEASQPNSLENSQVKDEAEKPDQAARVDSTNVLFKALGRFGAEATASFNSRAKSLMDLPNLFSPSFNLPLFEPGPSVTDSSSASPSAMLRSASLEKMGSSTSSLFEELDTQVISDHLDLRIIQTAIAKIRVHSEILSTLSPESLELPEVLENSEEIESTPNHIFETNQVGESAKQYTTPHPTTNQQVFFGGIIDYNVLPLLKTIRTVFSSPDALNHSFLPSGFELSSAELGLNIPSLRESFKIILDLEPKERVQHTLLSSFEVLLSSIQLNLKRYQTSSPALLRVFMVLLENPFLANDEHNGRILTKTCAIFRIPRTKTTQPSRKVVVHLRHRSQHTCNHHFFPLHRPDEILVQCIQTLSFFNRANNVAKPRPIVPINTFYNDTLASKLNFKEEYRIWKDGASSSHTQQKKPGTTSPKKPEFSYLNYPFLFDPVSKTRIMHIDAMAQMSLEYEEAVVHQAIVIHAQRFLQADSGTVKVLEEGLRGQTNPYLVLELRRQHLVKDVLDQIHKKENDLKKPLKVKFVGGGEEGHDQGGVQKEFFQVIVNLLLDPTYGMFTYDPETRYSWINPTSLEPERQFELVGILLGLALYNGVILGINFVPLLYKKLVGETVGLDDVKIAFPGLGKGLEMLLEWDATNGDVEDVFMRSFDIEYEVWGKVKTVPLVNGGSDIPVTNENRKDYVDLYIKHYTGECVKRLFDAFKRGFHRVCAGPALKMCRAEELEMLICGTNELNFNELEAGAKYDDGYEPSHPVIKNFWSIAHNMSQEHKKQLLMFVTASDRVPLKGLANLVFVIQRNGPDTDRLPTALTCFGRLLLPEYSSAEKLENRLITAIENAKGFGLV